MARLPIPAWPDEARDKSLRGPEATRPVLRFPSIRVVQREGVAKYAEDVLRGAPLTRPRFGILLLYLYGPRRGEQVGDAMSAKGFTPLHGEVGATDGLWGNDQMVRENAN